MDLFLATTIGYGNAGWLVNELRLEPQHVEAMARSYYMMQQLQQQYAFVPPKAIEYADRNGGVFAPSQALANDAIANSRLHVVYENGTEVYVNRDTAGEWAVRDPEGNTVTLPVDGWLAFNRDNRFLRVVGRLRRPSDRLRDRAGVRVPRRARPVDASTATWVRPAALRCGRKAPACWN